MGGRDSRSLPKVDSRTCASVTKTANGTGTDRGYNRALQPVGGSTDVEESRGLVVWQLRLEKWGPGDPRWQDPGVRPQAHRRLVGDGVPQGRKGLLLHRRNEGEQGRY